MSRPRIALLNAAHDPQPTRRNFRRELDADLVEYHLPGGDRPGTFDVDGAIVTGSKASVYWDEPWIDETATWVREAIDRGIPFLGVCFGHQYLADVLGGRVEDMGEYEIGYREVRRTVPENVEDPLFDGIGDEVTVFTTHSDRVVETPPGAAVLAENDYGIHGFRTGDVFGVQAHPEYDLGTAEDVTLDKDDQLDDDTMERVLDGIHEDNYGAACEAKRLFENFVRFVDERRSAGSDGEGERPTAADD
jgi:GMP synthase (glutamine-hydrolysing)